MTRLEAMDALLVKVKAGEAYNGRWGMIKAVFSPDLESAIRFKEAWQNHSTDAAIALLEAVLPDFTWLIRGADRQDDALYQGKFLANIWNSDGNPNIGTVHYHVWSDTPARALLIAILEAMKAQEVADV